MSTYTHQEKRLSSVRIKGDEVEILAKLLLVDLSHQELDLLVHDDDLQQVKQRDTGGTRTGDGAKFSVSALAAFSFLVLTIHFSPMCSVFLLLCTVKITQLSYRPLQMYEDFLGEI